MTRCAGPCLPPPDFDLISYEVRGFGMSWPDRKADQHRREDEARWAAKHGIELREALRLWRETGCWHNREASA
jgi:pimeloyl-ACP methyl ester carboxylesterase